MYRPKRTVSKRRAGRILRGIYACFFAALFIGIMILPAKEIQAAGKVYPVDAFNGVWDYSDKGDATTFTLMADLSAVFYVVTKVNLIYIIIGLLILMKLLIP